MSSCATTTAFSHQSFARKRPHLDTRQGISMQGRRQAQPHQEPLFPSQLTPLHLCPLTSVSWPPTVSAQSRQHCLMEREDVTHHGRSDSACRCHQLRSVPPSSRRRGCLLLRSWVPVQPTAK